jgi:hypothetical protein
VSTDAVLRTVNTALMTFYRPFVECDVLGFFTKEIQESYLRRHVSLARKYERRARWHVSRRQRAAFLGLARRWRRAAESTRARIAKLPKTTRFGSMSVTWSA